MTRCLGLPSLWLLILVQSWQICYCCTFGCELLEHAAEACCTEAKGDIWITCSRSWLLFSLPFWEYSRSHSSSPTTTENYYGCVFRGVFQGWWCQPAAEKGVGTIWTWNRMWIWVWTRNVNLRERVIFMHIEQLQLRHENMWQSTSVWQKKYCAQWQLKGSRCLTHDLCAIFVGFTQRDNCAIAIVNIIKA